MRMNGTTSHATAPDSRPGLQGDLDELRLAMENETSLLQAISGRLMNFLDRVVGSEPGPPPPDNAKPGASISRPVMPCISESRSANLNEISVINTLLDRLGA